MDRVVVLEVGSARLVLDAGLVTSVGEADVAAGETRRLDLYRRLTGCDAPAGARLLKVALDGGEALLLAGEHVAIEAVAPSSVQPLPAFLEGLRQSVGAVGIVAREGGFALLVDPARLPWEDA